MMKVEADNVKAFVKFSKMLHVTHTWADLSAVELFSSKGPS